MGLQGQSVSMQVYGMGTKAEHAWDEGVKILLVLSLGIVLAYVYWIVPVLSSEEVLHEIK